MGACLARSFASRPGAGFLHHNKLAAVEGEPQKHAGPPPQQPVDLRSQALSARPVSSGYSPSAPGSTVRGSFLGLSTAHLLSHGYLCMRGCLGPVGDLNPPSSAFRDPQRWADTSGEDWACQVSFSGSNDSQRRNPESPADMFVLPTYLPQK